MSSRTFKIVLRHSKLLDETFHDYTLKVQGWYVSKLFNEGFCSIMPEPFLKGFFWPFPSIGTVDERPSRDQFEFSWMVFDGLWRDERSAQRIVMAEQFFFEPVAIIDETQTSPRPWYLFHVSPSAESL